MNTTLKPILIRLAYFLIGAILVFLLMRNCTGQTITVKTPVLSGTFKHDTITKIEYQRIVTKGDEVVKYIPTVREIVVNKTDTAYIAYANDTIRTQQFSKAFENDTIKLNIFGTVTGTIDSLNAKWLFKSIKVPVNVPKCSRWGIGVFGGVDYKGTPTGGVGLTYSIFKI